MERPPYLNFGVLTANILGLGYLQYSFYINTYHLLGCLETKINEDLRKHACAICSDFFSYKNYNFQLKRNYMFLIFALKVNCGYTLDCLNEAVLTSTHNLCLRLKIRK